ncbi:hypothetical protein FRB94_013688 [Tulasnella sp. JGI-2019a]|nr:hypothetical protein FRB93_011961 [Tulasnella sp. JGI-2019a]KAG9008131.1 hypothetical protein FRB94_013688 [Tulasnella sp. JGI-2019a]KAG9033518.1 hypothetical protein FRB95_014697 [Tulasnella sp. JGI-2019a]
MTITQDTSAPLVVVVGATGIQGGSVINALSESDKLYRIRGLTRDANKDAAKALTKRGVEMVAVNLNVENREQAFKTFEGATYAFVVTNFWEHMQMDREVAEGKMLVDAAAYAKVKLLVWSGLESMIKVSNGKYKHVYHFDGKAEVTEYAKAVGTPAVADVQAGWYMSNFAGESFGLVKKQEDGSYAIITPADPNSTVPLIDAARDYGLFVRKVIESPTHEPFTAVYAHSEVMTQSELAKQFSEGTGKTIKFVQISEDRFKQGALALGMSEIIAAELNESFMSHSDKDVGYFGHNDLRPSKQGLARAPRTWAEFIKVTDWSKVLN